VVAACVVQCAASAQADPRSPVFLPFTHAPLDTPMVLTGTFGDRRGGHFHAGLDLSTAQVVGKPVYAPASGFVARVRTSGTGYGRSIYLQMDDGRLVVYGHLDAFAESVASYVDSAQRATTKYELDLWPPRNRFRVTPGAIVAWSGQSGAGPPHLHAEIRVGDMAHHPLRAGWSLADRLPPRIARITLVPVDEQSRVQRTTGPYTWRGFESDTIEVTGRFEVLVQAADVLGAKRDLAPWSTRVRLVDRFVECRFDSVSWAGDMSDAAYIYDGDAVRVAVPDGVMPRVLSAEWPGDNAAYGVTDAGDIRAGEFALASNAAALPLDITVRDVAGNTIARRIWVRAQRSPDRAAPEVTAAVSKNVTIALEPAGHGCVRVVLGNVPPRTRNVWVGTQGGTLVPAGRAGTRWSGLLRPSQMDSVTVVAVGVGRANWRAERTMNFLGVDLSPGEHRAASTEFRWVRTKDSVFESTVIAISERTAAATSELAPVSDVHVLEPDNLPLRKPWTVSLAPEPGADTSKVALYRRGSGSWEWAGDERDGKSGTWSVSTRRLGSFALFRDVTAPRVRIFAKPRPKGTAAYSRWAIEAVVEETGSGVDAERSQFLIDGSAVPTEWDPEAGRLRWRPRTPPAAGEHQVTARAVDRAGNVREVEGRFTSE
jgi:Peptidase family M23